MRLTYRRGFATSDIMKTPVTGITRLAKLSDLEDLPPIIRSDVIVTRTETSPQPIKPNRATNQDPDDDTNHNNINNPTRKQPDKYPP